MRKYLIHIIFVVFLSAHAIAQPASMDVSVYYTFKQVLDSCVYQGLENKDYNYYKLFSDNIPTNPGQEWRTDLINAITNYITDIHRGHGIATELSYNGVTKTTTGQDTILQKEILAISNNQDLLTIINKWQPQTVAYTILIEELKAQIQKGDAKKVKQLQKAMNAERWITHFSYDKYIVVNVAAAHLNYYENDSLLLSMKIVAGKPATPTPRFTAYCNEVVFYPYWHVPKSIIVKELLPACRKNPGILNYMNIQVLNAAGQVINPYNINWFKLNNNNFPYTLRQSTGCDNALGVVKFNLNSPFSVYMHDTNLKSAFKSSERYFSHGCIRIEKPIELANYLLPEKVDSNFLKACIKNQQPIVNTLNTPVPVFVIYQTAAVNDSNTISYCKDIYHLLN